MPDLPLRLKHLIPAQTLAGNNGRGRTQRVAWQVNQRGDRKGDKVAGDFIGAHTGDEDLRQQLAAVKQHGLNTRRHPDAQHLHQNGAIPAAEVAAERKLQRRADTAPERIEHRQRPDIARNRQPEARPDEAHSFPAQRAINQHAADNDVQDIHATVDQHRDFGVARSAQGAAADQRNRRRRVAPGGGLQIAQRQLFNLRIGAAGDDVDNQVSPELNRQRQHQRQHGHQPQRLPGGGAGAFTVTARQAKRHHHGGAEIDSGKKGDDHHVEAVCQPDTRHRLFAQPADQKRAQHAHQHHAEVFNKDRDRQRRDLTPQQRAVHPAPRIPRRITHRPYYCHTGILQESTKSLWIREER
ncbi:hypothetical protein COLO4_01232 [Corchorus olitorius]|uniref:Uncharacterized protein n=1 Tax=Corchorus olitorius TaxID=93759 RepID=A0A1R3L2Y7_9ROSI|nr:hypothetical protein COLO4_01232 [Corchorus olitorius]